MGNCCKQQTTEHQTITLSSKDDGTSYLQNVEYNNTVPFVPPIMVAKVIKVYDGDTITVASKLPYETSKIYTFQVRLNGIDSPEIKGKTKEEKDLAIVSRNTLSNMIYGKIVKLQNTATEKYGRLLADVYCGDVHINQYMLDNKLATEYDGGTKKRPREWGDVPTQMDVSDASDELIDVSV